MRASLKCMETGDKDKCEDFIEDYKTCRKEEQVGNSKLSSRCCVIKLETLTHETEPI